MFLSQLANITYTYTCQYFHSHLTNTRSKDLNPEPPVTIKQMYLTGKE